MLFNVVLSSFAATLALRASAVRTSTMISDTLRSAQGFLPARRLSYFKLFFKNANVRSHASCADVASYSGRSVSTNQ